MVQNDLYNSLKDGRVVSIETGHHRAASYDETAIENAVLSAAEIIGWAENDRGAFGRAIAAGSKVVIKPNMVVHRNLGTDGLLPLVTHPALIKAVVNEVLKADPAQVLVGDAPVQGCDFPQLLGETGLDRWAADLRQHDRRFAGIKDFRRTVCVFKNGVRIADEERRSTDEYILFNLGEESLLEPLTDLKNPFRVTQYDPREMARTHSPSNHQYLVAREIIDADVVINLPKLKTHKKAGITSALKNLVGINGNKEYLPHHRLGGADEGGDCYPGHSRLKRNLESVLDRQNMAESFMAAKFFGSLADQLERLVRFGGDETGVEGAWSGNLTVAAMTLDLNRILLYGRPDAEIANTIQRRVLHIVDAVIAGQGDGPLASDELPLGRILASNNAAAADWVGAHMLAYDAGKIPLLSDAFAKFRWPITDVHPDEVKLLGRDGGRESLSGLLDLAKKKAIHHPGGWLAAAAQ